MNLYVDDMREAPDGWVHATTVADAKTAIELGFVDLLSLDHDMGVCSACKSLGPLNWCPHIEDGTALINWMEEFNMWPTARPVVHSQNPVARKRMEAAIERHYGRI